MTVVVLVRCLSLILSLYSSSCTRTTPAQEAPALCTALDHPVFSHRYVRVDGGTNLCSADVLSTTHKGWWKFRFPGVGALRTHELFGSPLKVSAVEISERLLPLVELN